MARREKLIVDVGTTNNRTLHIRLKLACIVLKHLCSLLVQRILRVGVLGVHNCFVCRCNQSRAEMSSVVDPHSLAAAVHALCIVSAKQVALVLDFPGRQQVHGSLTLARSTHQEQKL